MTLDAEIPRRFSWVSIRIRAEEPTRRFSTEISSRPRSDQPLMLAGGMTLDDGWRTENSSAGQPIIVVGHHFETESWRKIGFTHTGNVMEEYDGNYSEAAMRIYEKYKEKN